MKDTLLKLEHENDVLTQKNAELAAELEVWKMKTTEYAGIVKEMRRDMEGMSRLRTDQEELVGNIIDIFDDYIDPQNAVIVGDDYDMLAGKIEKILKGAE